MLSRRNFLKLGSLTAVAAASGCTLAGQEVAQARLPAVLPIAPADAGSNQPVLRARRLLNRAGYGPRPGDVEQVLTLGFDAYLEQQLDPDTIDDTAVSLLDSRLTLYDMDISQLIEQEPRDASRELIGATLVRAVYSERQLLQAMVEFWSDHFNIYLRKNQFTPLLKLADDRDVIRPHAMGNFRQLLGASAQSPAMLIYLDNARNSKDQPNENYARELLELHTLGVAAGYSQQDVLAVARILTGWRVARRGLKKGMTVFQDDQHDFGEKVVLGTLFPAGRGAEELADLLDLLVAQPATAVFIATKLVRRFVADAPPARLINEVANTFTTHDGDIKAMLRVIFLSEEFAAAPPKLKRPFTFMVSTLRALHSDIRPQARALANWLPRLGQVPFNWPPPNGYPDVAPPWASNLLPRWNFALALVHGHIGGVTPPLEKIIQAGQATTPPAVLDLMAQLTLGHSLTANDRQLFHEYIGDGLLRQRATREKLKDSVALMLASPAFQWT